MRTARNQRVQRTISLLPISVALCLILVGKAASTAEQIDQSNLPAWAGGWTHVNPTSEAQTTMWQTFTPGRPNLTAVEIDILTISPGRGDDTLTVEIAKDGEILTSADCYVEDGFDGLLRFEFPDAAPLVPEQLYELRVRDTGKTRFGWKYAQNTYDRGSRYVFAQEKPGTDWLFQTYSKLELPEPYIIYVDDDATGRNDGSSWADAYIYLQEALADADSAEKPLEIRVAQSIYKPDQGLLAIPEFDWRTATFQLINGVTLKGGFAGVTETDPNSRDIELYETILSGDLAGDDGPNFTNNTENSYHVVTGDLNDESAVLDGFTIIAGNANGHTWRFRNGGGMYNYQSSPTMTNCTFIGNSAERSGGGMYNRDKSNPTLTNCIFSGNSANGGGGMDNSESNPILTNCNFNQNSANGGGGMDNNHSSPTLTNCNFIENLAENGGGMFNNNNSRPTLTNCNFNTNSAEYSGGMGNTNNSSPTLTNCNFSGNSAEIWGGGMWNSAWSSPTLTNCTFSQNSAEMFGGMFNINNSSPTLTNCIIWYNKPNKILSATITYSNIQGGFTGVGNIDADPLFAELGYWADVNDPNIIVVPGTPYGEPNDPNAVWVDGDYHLKSQAGRWDPNNGSWVKDDVTSPCIDAGDPNSDWSGEVWPHGERINMGAYGGTQEASMSAPTTEP